ncbi:unnamed protein product [Onchocerca flexuosa]|uniref:Uncharacterized protein n=1 Tax=Onchocerca flexuosa TaxID=387005 RepID=A0A183H8S8_9BILA|nr:unnamed protein product [Onchocerca flexuosa]
MLEVRKGKIVPRGLDFGAESIQIRRQFNSTNNLVLGFYADTAIEVRGSRSVSVHSNNASQKIRRRSSYLRSGTKAMNIANQAEKE